MDAHGSRKSYMLDKNRTKQSSAYQFTENKNKRESECTLDYSKFERSVYFVFNS